MTLSCIVRGAKRVVVVIVDEVVVVVVAPNMSHYDWFSML